MSALHETDVVVIGAGPVGLFAVFECGMLGLRCHVIDGQGFAGGQCTALYPDKPIYDIPAHPRIAARDLIAQLEAQAAPFAPHYRLGDAAVALQPAGERWIVGTKSGARIAAGAVIVAGGAGELVPNRPDLARLDAHEHSGGVLYGVRDASRLAGRRVVIAGGGDSAVDWALMLAPSAAHVTIVHRRTTFRAAPESARQLETLAAGGRVTIAAPARIAALVDDGTPALRAVRMDVGGDAREVACDHVLFCFGLVNALGPIRDWGLALDDAERVVVDPATMATSRAGVFAAGDVVTYPGKLKLILTGFAEVALAAQGAHACCRPGERLPTGYSTTRGVPLAA
jgi:thioredoxin reductase (NADPH)